MKRLHVTVLMAVLAVIGVAGMANATLLTFEDDPDPFPPGYNGLNWDSNLRTSNSSSYMAWGNTYPPPSGIYVVANNRALSVTITSALDFDFNGAYFAAFGEDNTAVSWTSTAVTVEGYNNGTWVDSVTMALRADAFTWLQADLYGVDELRILSTPQAGGGGTWWLMDNFTFNEAAPVPEPATMLLFGTGLAGFTAMWRCKRQQ